MGLTFPATVPRGGPNEVGEAAIDRETKRRNYVSDGCFTLSPIYPRGQNPKRNCS